MGLASRTTAPPVYPGSCGLMLMGTPTAKTRHLLRVAAAAEEALGLNDKQTPARGPAMSDAGQPIGYSGTNGA